MSENDIIYFCVIELTRPCLLNSFHFYNNLLVHVHNLWWLEERAMELWLLTKYLKLLRKQIQRTLKSLYKFWWNIGMSTKQKPYSTIICASIKKYFKTIVLQIRAKLIQSIKEKIELAWNRVSTDFTKMNPLKLPST